MSKTRVFSWALLLATLQTTFAVRSPPYMVKQPSNTELLFKVKTREDENDKPFIIECEAEGTPSPEYRWEKNGKPFEWSVYDDRINQQPGRGSLVITNPQAEDTGSYICYASNEFGTAASNSVFVRQSTLNSFKEASPKTVSVEEGKPLKIECEAPGGWPKPTVYWMIQNTNGALKTINSSRLTVDPEGNLLFSNVTRRDASNEFFYACSAASYFRSEYKLGNRVVLQVSQSGSSAGLQNKVRPTQQYVTRKNHIAYRGQSAKMWCIFGGTPLPEIRWTKRGGALPQGRTNYDNYGKTLVIEHVDFEDEGDYTCEATNGVGIAQSYSIQLTVYAAPYFTKEPESHTKAEGEDVMFECEADGFPAPKILWIHNGVSIDKAPPNPRRTVTSNSIIIKNLTKLDTGNYGCNATAQASDRYIYKDVFINVLALPPEIRVPPQRELLTVTGSQVTLTCETFGAPKPIVKWFRENTELTGNRYKISADGSLVISDVKYLDAGHYLCNATNRFDSKVAKGSLVVKDHTQITQGPQPYEVEAGDTATFRCNAVADIGLELEINWLKDGRRIDFEVQPRFIRTNDNSLTITKSTELDSGSYTCEATTVLDKDLASASLIVQDVPNPPELLEVECNSRDADVKWGPRGDNRAPILSYKIQYNTSFIPDTWETATDLATNTATSFKVSMSPWSNYTFRVIARNKVGDSLPSGHSKVCLTPEDVPYKNPENVIGRGTAPNNLVIYWTRMPQIDHNAPKFQYRVYWRRDDSPNWQIENIADWKQKELLVPNQPKFTKYRMKVVAHNQKGEANVAPEEVVGYSGEAEPGQAPTNFVLKDVVNSRTAVVSWDPVDPKSMNGFFKGYKILSWTDSTGEENQREIIIRSDATLASVSSFKPFTVNYAKVLAFNGAYNGPASNTITIRTPEGKPGPAEMLQCWPMGSSALLLEWTSPQEINGVLTGYRIYYAKVKGTEVGAILLREPSIRNNRTTRAKLAGLNPHSKYRVTIRATTNAGEGMPYYTDCDTKPQSMERPSVPSFKHSHLRSSSGRVKIKVTWVPDINGNPGSHFYVEYRKRTEPLWSQSDEQLNENYLVVQGLHMDAIYEFRVVAVDGAFTTPSAIQEVNTYTDKPVAADRGGVVVASSGWFIGMLLALVFLLASCVVVCLVKRNRGGKYAVQEQEVAHGRPEYEEGGFMEYAQRPGEKRKPSLSSEMHYPPESDTESIADYADGNDAAGMDEDGSFIGKYARDRNSEQSSAFATLV